MNPPRQPPLKSDTLTSTAVRIQVNAQGNHHDLLDCADRKASYPREQIVWASPRSVETSPFKEGRW
jgi:hypothetical protein